MLVPTLRLVAAGTGANGHSGEVCACAYTPDGAFVLSGGWDGHLRLWEATTGAPVTAFRAGEKPISACAVSPDGKQWVTGSMDGLLSTWDSVTQRRLSIFLAHTRPISAIVHSADGEALATASWDRNVILWNQGRERDGKPLTGHGDIVAGCQFTPDGRQLVSWSHDKTVRVWDVARGRLVTTLASHDDRVTVAAVSPDGHWAASGSRDGVLKLWDLRKEREVGSATLSAEMRACFFLPDGASLVTVNARGRLVIHTTPDLEERTECVSRVPLQCAQLAPSGQQIALGGDDGRVRFASVDGLEGVPLLATATPTPRRTATGLQRLFGRGTTTEAYSCTCPACRQAFELPGTPPGRATPCPHCNRQLRFSAPLPPVPASC